MVGSLYIESLHSSVSTQAVKNAVANLSSNPSFKNSLVSSLSSGASIHIRITDNPNADGAVTYKSPNSNLYYIDIPKQGFDGNTYNGTDNATHVQSLERYLAHEARHVEQRVKGQYPTPNDTPAAEADAMQFENKVMGEYAGEQPATGDPINADISAGNANIINPNDPASLNGNKDPASGWITEIDAGLNGVAMPLMIDHGGFNNDMYWYTSPLALDIDGAGINLVSRESADSVFFDIDIDGTKEHTGWIGDGTGLLALDRNSNGTIDNNSELFGNQPSSGIANGFAKLAALDSNSDGHITSADMQFGDLRVWLDTNQDGVSQSGELHTLSSLLITDIDLGYSNSSAVIAGNLIKQTSTFTINGNTQTIVDAWFNYDNIVTQYMGIWTLDPDALFLPDQRGYGNIPALHIAISEDATLKSMVADLASQSPEDLFDPVYDLKSKITDILFQWAGVTSMDPDSRGDYFDARKLTFLEEITGNKHFLDATPPTSTEAANLEKVWQKALDYLTAHLLGQTEFTTLIGNAYYDVVSDRLIINDAEIDTKLYFVADENSSSTIFGTTNNDVLIFRAGDTISYSGQINISNSTGDSFDTILLVGGISSEDTKTWVDQYGSLHIKYTNNDQINVGGTVYLGVSDITTHISQIAFDDGTVWNYSNGIETSDTNDGHASYGTVLNDTIFGNGGVDGLYGAGGDDVLNGGADDDSVSGGTGSDILIGGAGNDTLYGATGDDTYIMVVGYGGDTINEYASEGHDAIQMAGFDSADIRLWANQYGALHIQNKSDSSDDAIVYGDSAGHYAIEEIIFDDVTVNIADGLNVEGTNSDDLILYGTAGNDTIDGYAGNDNISGMDGNDIINAGYGDDYVYAGNGVDTIYGENGNDSLYGDGGNDILNGGAADDYLGGGSDADTFVFDTSTLGSVDTVTDFSLSQGDKLDISSILFGYDPLTSLIDDFISFTSGAWGIGVVSVDRDGTGSTYSAQQIAYLATGISGLDADTMLSNGNLIA